MNYRDRLFHQMSNVGKAYRRYPLTMLLLVLLTLTNTWNIVDESPAYEAIIHTLLIGITLTLVVSHLNERFIQDRMKKFALLALAILLSTAYYFFLPPNNAYYFIAEVRTGVIIFTLFIAFIWIPSIKNTQAYFYQHFLAAFKYTFTTILYALILTLGIQSIISTVDYLFFSVDYDYFTHAANIIWFIFATSYFLSLIPETRPYWKAAEQSSDEKEQITGIEAFELTNFLKILINYIVLPLIGIYTLILLIYIALNITGEFWTDNLLEPMLISYTIILILVYLLASNIEDEISLFFRKVFPKILILIVLFQTISSLLKIGEMGISYGRYYVILFGVFSLVAGLIFSFLPKEQSGLIVPVLIILAFFSVIPPVDAFTVAEKSQKNLLTSTLTENNMLEPDKIVSKKEVNQKDKEKITSSIEYLENHDYIDELAYLPKDFEAYEDFEEVFGFPMTYDRSEASDELYHYASIDRSNGEIMDIRSEDYFAELFIENYEDSAPIENIQINNEYFLHVDNTKRYPIIIIEDGLADQLLEINLENLYEKVFAGNPSNEGMPSQEEMTLLVENEDLRVRVLAYELMKNESDEDEIISAQLYLFIQIKD